MPAGEYTFPDGGLNFGTSHGATAEPPPRIQALARATISSRGATAWISPIPFAMAGRICSPLNSI